MRYAADRIGLMLISRLLRAAEVSGVVARFCGVLARLDPFPVLLERTGVSSGITTATVAAATTVALVVAGIVSYRAARNGAMGPSPHVISASSSLPQSDAESASESLADTSACGSSSRFIASRGGGSGAERKKGAAGWVELVGSVVGTANVSWTSLRRSAVVCRSENVGPALTPSGFSLGLYVFVLFFEW